LLGQPQLGTPFLSICYSLSLELPTALERLVESMDFHHNLSFHL